LSLPDEESERNMYFLGIMRLEQAGYMQYEISNFAKKGRACRHNLKYWNCEDYIGLGPSAHSYFGGIRYSYQKDIKKYVNSILRPQPNMSSQDIFGKNDIYDDYIPVRPTECIGEYVMLRLRLKEGVSLASFTRRFGQDFEALYIDKLSPFIASGHVRRTKAGYALTPDGMYVSNYILARVVDFE
jgi:oxygen-independent coproporphyrinogen-3 oxidase